MILCVEVNKIKKELTLYQLPKKQLIGCVNSLKVEALSLFLLKRKLKVDIAILDLYRPYIDLFYTLYPEVLVCVSPYTIKRLFEQGRINTEEKTYFIEEVAATIDYPAAKPDESNILEAFITLFYGSKNQDEALALYELWQTYIPLNVPKVYRLVRTIEFYKNEIFNYFELKKALAVSK